MKTGDSPLWPDCWTALMCAGSFLSICATVSVSTKMTSTSKEAMTHQVRAVPTDQRDLARLLVRVDNPQQPHELVRFHRRPDFDPDRVPQSAEELDVRAVERARAVANPDGVGRGAVVAFLARCGGGEGWDGKEASEGGFVLEHEGLRARRVSRHNGSGRGRGAPRGS